MIRTTSIRQRFMLLAFCVAALPHSVVQAVLVNQYTFNDGDAEDSVGGQDGVLMGTATVGDLGRLLLTGGQPRNSYLWLPDGIASSAAQGGTPGAFSFELWAHANTNANWAALASFGGAAGQDETYNGSAKDYVQLIPQNGSNGRLRVTTHAANAGGEGFVDWTSPLSTTDDQHIVVVVDQSSGTPGTVSLYLDAALVGQSAIAANLNVSTMLDNDNWLGRSQWPDVSFDGSYDEFRIYNHALSPIEVADNYLTGPDPPPTVLATPRLVVDRNLGTLDLRGGQTTMQIVGYTISSAYEALNPSAWQPVAGSVDAPPSGNGAFDSNDHWTVISGTASDFTEFELEGGDGGALGSRSRIHLGAEGAWVRSPVEDLQMQLKLDDGTLLEIPVIFTGNNDMPLLRSDLDFDGQLTPLDWQIFSTNSHANLASYSPAAAYGHGDLDGDGDNDYDDFVLFKLDYQAANGISAFAQLLLPSTVPEPSSVTLAMFVTGVCLHLRNASRSTAR